MSKVAGHSYYEQRRYDFCLLWLVSHLCELWLVSSCSTIMSNVFMSNVFMTTVVMTNTVAPPLHHGLWGTSPFVSMLMFLPHMGWGGGCIAQWKHFCFPPSSPGCKSRQCQDFLSLLLSLWTESRSNPSIAKQSISQFQLAVTNRAKYYKKVSPAHAYTEVVWSWCRAFRDR